MTRRALLFEPTYRTIEPGRDAYLRSGMLNRLINPLYRSRLMTKKDERQAYKEAEDTIYEPLVRTITSRHELELSERYWMFRRRATTVALSGNRFAKSLEPFDKHKESEITFYEFMRECAQYGVLRPSSYGDVAHELLYSPRIALSINMPFMNRLVGGVQMAVPGIHFGTFRKYDLISAYLGAIKNGLPDPTTFFRCCDPFKRRHNCNGLFLVRLLGPTWNAPSPFNRLTVSNLVIATAEEIETYNLKVGEILDGVLWDGFIDTSEILNTIKQFTFWKAIGRSWWGKFGQCASLHQITSKSTRVLKNRYLNMPWAHFIISNVTLRLWPYMQSINCVHAHTDHVITRDILPTGNDIGDFRLEKEYAAGIVVEGPGSYGDILEDQLEKMAGVPHGSTRRNNPVPEWKAVQTA